MSNYHSPRQSFHGIPASLRILWFDSMDVLHGLTQFGGYLIANQHICIVRRSDAQILHKQTATKYKYSKIIIIATDKILQYYNIREELHTLESVPSRSGLGREPSARANPILREGERKDRGKPH